MAISARTWIFAGFCCLMAPRLAAEELRLPAAALFEKSVTRSLVLAEDGRAIALERGELFEDDGPASGYSYKPNEEKVAGEVWIRKELVVADPRADQATLLVGRGGELQAEINGRAVKLEGAGKAGNYWQVWTFPPDALVAGKNEIVLHGTGNVWIARADEFPAGVRPPRRSARSSDGGKTWQQRLGPEGNLSGEYYVRLALDRHRTLGTLLSPVFDAGNLAGGAIAPAVERLGPVKIALASRAGDAGQVKARVRFSREPAVDSKSWSEWRVFEPGASLDLGDRRYLQVALELSPRDPRRSPAIESLSIEASPKLAGDRPAFKVLEQQNPELVRSGVPFVYEPFDHPRLRKFREAHKLDEVVKDATSEWQLITRLAAWSSRQWDSGHLKDTYPGWDALEILKPHADGKPVGGFCQQYNLVLLQACESFGLVGRAVSMGPGVHAEKIRGGHEVVEIWSNEHRKWVYIDGNAAWYAIDTASRVPLSLLELRGRQLAAFQGEAPRPIEIVTLAETKHAWKGLESWPPFVELRLIPRSNFLAERDPLPLNQGMRGWFWPGHYVWSDALAAPPALYAERVRKRGDWEWTVNQVRMALEETGQAGELRVHLESDTPGFESYQAKIDEGAKRAVESGFVWKLSPGKNRLEVAPRNKAGRDGAASWLVVESR